MYGYKIGYIDTDPDTGKKSQFKVLANTYNKNNALWIREALNYDWYSEDGPCDPTREFYVMEDRIGGTIIEYKPKIKSPKKDIDVQLHWGC